MEVGLWTYVVLHICVVIVMKFFDGRIVITVLVALVIGPLFSVEIVAGGIHCHSLVDEN